MRPKEFKCDIFIKNEEGKCVDATSVILVYEGIMELIRRRIDVVVFLSGRALDMSKTEDFVWFMEAWIDDQKNKA
jgi:hypothetical protein